MMAAACGSGQRAIRDVVLVMAMAGLRWGELAGLRVGDRVSVPMLGHVSAAMTMDLYGHRVWEGTLAIRGRC
jgi:hypothetical protein